MTKEEKYDDIHQRYQKRFLDIERSVESPESMAVMRLRAICDKYREEQMLEWGLGELVRALLSSGYSRDEIVGEVEKQGGGRDTISERTKAGLGVKRARGERTGGVPYGWKVGEGKVLVEEEGEQVVIREIREMKEKEGHSLRDIAEWLNSAGYRTRSGGEWRHQYVDNVLKGKKE